MKSANNNVVTSPTEDGAYSKMETSVNCVDLHINEIPPIEPLKDNTLQPRCKMGNTEPVLDQEESAQNYGHGLRDSELKDVLKSLHFKPDSDDLIGRTKISKITYHEELLGAEVSFGRLLYKHHGVVTQMYDDIQEVTILHVSGDSSDSISGSVSSTTKAQIGQKKIPFNQIDYRYVYENVVYNDDTIRCRAKYLYHYYNKLDGVSYHLGNFNCEHFASFIVNGQMFCNQVGNKCCCCCKLGAINDDKRKYLNSQLLKKIKKDMGERYADTHTTILREEIDGRCRQCCGCVTLFCTLRKDAAQNIEEDPFADEIRLLQEHFDSETVDSIRQDLKLH